MTSISIVVATRNRTDSLHATLDSIDRQSYNDFEVLVTDDGSKEKVIALNKAYCTQLGDRFRFLEPTSPNCRGSGPSGARNRGAKSAKGKYLAFLDDDDQFLCPDYLAKAVLTLEQNHADFFFGMVQGIKDGKACHPKWSVPMQFITGLNANKVELNPFNIQERYFRAIAQPYIIHPGQMVISKDLFDRVGGFFEGLWSNSEDRNLMLRLLDQAGGVYAWMEPCLLYRIPTQDSISLTEKMEVHILQRILSGQHALLHCKRPSIRIAARSGISWSLREYAENQLVKGFYKDALLFALQSLVAFPSFGGLFYMVKFLLKIAKSRCQLLIR